MNIVRIICLLLVVFTALLLFACTNSNQAIVNNPTNAPTVEPTALPSLTPQPNITDSGELVEYTVSRSISSNMVVQRNSYFNVFGWSENIGGIIYAEFMGEKRYGVVNDSGEWMIEFSPHDATSEAQLLKIYPSNGKVTEYDNILIGDVWVVSGQSNAELTFAATIAKTPDYKNEISKEDKIRIFTQSRAGVLSVQKKIDISKAQDDAFRPPRANGIMKKACWSANGLASAPWISVGCTACRTAIQRRSWKRCSAAADTSSTGSPIWRPISSAIWRRCCPSAIWPMPAMAI